ncbi:hypothetical protein C8J57DRAFT_1250950 [Mycena rebaudengoi]|nr:hypothetical protein C8J57DRAFT_1250950 [Mycena rebaudengoi]
MLTKVFYTLAASAFAALVAHIYDSEPSFSPRNITATAVQIAAGPSSPKRAEDPTLTQTGQAEDPKPDNAERARRDWRREDGNGAQRFNDKGKKMGAGEEPRTVTELWVIIEGLRVRDVCTRRGGGMLLVKRH